MLLGTLCHPSLGLQFLLAAAHRGTSGNLPTLEGMTLGNTNVKQVMCVEMTPKALFSLVSVSI